MNWPGGCSSLSLFLILLGGLIETRSSIGLYIWIKNTYDNYDDVVDGDDDEVDVMMKIVQTPIP